MNYSFDNDEYSRVLEKLASDLDVSPSDFLKMQKRYKSVTDYLESQEVGVTIESYPQGSFALGTVTRPYRDDKDADFDVDVVNEYKIDFNKTTPEKIKNATGDWLNENGNYRPILDKEGKRCWTLKYAEKSPGFHIDILPVCLGDDALRSRLATDGINQDVAQSASKFTHQESRVYQFLDTNPKGYLNWFKEVQAEVMTVISEPQRKRIFSNDKQLISEYNFSSHDDIPEILVRTPLQRVIQILKRHRDVRFSGRDNSDDRPISIVITTICGLLYNGEADIYSALKNIVSKIDIYSPLLEDRYNFNESLAELNVIKRNIDGTWEFPNPVEPRENFAEQWHKNSNAKAKAFFQWVEWVREDFLTGNEKDNLKRIFGENRFLTAMKATALSGVTHPSSASFPSIQIAPKNIEKPYASKY